MISPSQPHIEVFDQEALWNSCIGMVARLPIRVDSITFRVAYLDDAEGRRQSVMEPSASAYWAGGIATDFMEFRANDAQLSSPRPQPTKLTPLELDILHAMGEPVVERRKVAKVVTDMAPPASRYPELAHRVAVACLKRATSIELGWLSDDPDDVGGPFCPSANHPSQFNSIGAETIWAGALLGNMERLTDIRRRLAPIVGEDAAPYEADYLALQAICDRIAPRAIDWPHQRSISLSVAGLRELGLKKLLECADTGNGDARFTPGVRPNIYQKIDKAS